MGTPFPLEELAVIDMTVRMFTEPMLRGDLDLLARIWEDENRLKGPRMAALGVTATELQSADKFAELLRAEGIEPEKKKGKNGDIYAFAKTDPFMRDYLLEHESERVRMLAEVRLAVKSTVLQTRAETFGWMARRGPMPVYLRYAGAGTLRFSGGDGCLAADTKILTLDTRDKLTYKSIVDVQLTDFVWDGEEFVSHDGVAFSGYQKVIEHDGIEATENHQVFTDSHTSISLAEAKSAGTKIMDCREPTSWEVESAKRR